MFQLPRPISEVEGISINPHFEAFELICYFEIFFMKKRLNAINNKVIREGRNK